MSHSKGIQDSISFDMKLKSLTKFFILSPDTLVLKLNWPGPELVYLSFGEFITSHFLSTVLGRDTFLKMDPFIRENC